MNCQECNKPTKNEGSACAGAIAQEIHFGATGGPMDTTGLITCNCCDKCRIACHNSFMDSVDAGEQKSNCIE